MKNILKLVLFLFALNLCSQTEKLNSVLTSSEDQSNGAYLDTYIKKSWQKLDKNNDKSYSEKRSSQHLICPI